MKSIWDYDRLRTTSDLAKEQAHSIAGAHITFADLHVLLEKQKAAASAASEISDYSRRSMHVKLAEQ
jgi:hypothetical protein